MNTIFKARSFSLSNSHCLNLAHHSEMQKYANFAEF